MNTNRTVEKGVYDPFIIDRVKKYLEQKEHSPYVDVNQMAHYLHEKHVEYRRRKFVPFRKMVKRACDVVAQMYSVSLSPNCSSDEDSDCRVMVEEKPTNLMNCMMSSIYSKKRVQPDPEQAKALSDAIPLSSDEDDEGAQMESKVGAFEKKRLKVGDVEVKPVILKEPVVKIGETTIKRTYSFPSATPETVKVNSSKQNAPDKTPIQNPPTNKLRNNSKRFKKMVNIQESFVTFRKIGGMERTLKDLCELLLHIKCPFNYYSLGLHPPCGLLLHGPPGCGKTLLARAIAGQMQMPIVEVPGCELIAGVSGESEERIRDVFEQANLYAPCVLFIDDIDVIAVNRTVAQKDMERRMVSQLITCMDNLRSHENEQQVIVIGATTRPESMDPGLRRVGRFEHEIPISIPNRKDRKHILMLITEDLAVDPDLDYDKLAELTPGYVGADLFALVTRASTIAIKRKSAEQLREAKERVECAMDTVDLDADEETGSKPAETKEPEPVVKPAVEIKDIIPPTDVQHKEPTLLELMRFLDHPPDDMNISLDFYISLEDFKVALKQIQPAAKREGFITVPDVTWDDVGSLQNIREELKLAVLAPVKYPERLKKLGLNAPSGVLLCGPPGCGKTLLAKAIANEAGINFISVKGPELMSMYVGESERAVRVCFQRARNSAPCVIFFDEFDSLCPKRSSGSEASAGTRIVNQLLTEMDGVEDRQGVYILAATNRPDIIDPAILRPGRLDTILYVGLPDFEDRIDILKATTKNRTKPLLDDDVDFKYLAERTNGFTGADMAGLVRQAAMLVLKESLSTVEQSNTEIRVSNRHFNEALSMLRPSVTAQDRKIYENLRVKFGAPRDKTVVTIPTANIDNSAANIDNSAANIVTLPTANIDNSAANVDTPAPDVIMSDANTVIRI